MALLPALALAMTTVPPPQVRSAPIVAVAPAPTSCLPAAVIKGAKVVALGAYSGNGQSVSFQLAGSNRNSVHRVVVTGGGTGDVVLVVAAYEPTLWDISAIKGRVKAVVASGYYPQAVIGVSDAVPVRFSSSVGNFKGSDTCGHVRYAYDSTGEIQLMAADIRKAIGVYPRQFYGQYSVSQFDIDGGVPANANIPDLKDVRAGVPIVTEDDPNAPGEMVALPSSNEIGLADPKVHFVEWDENGQMIRDQNGTGLVARPVREAGTPALPRASMRSAGGGSWFGWLVVFAIGGFAAWRNREFLKRWLADFTPRMPQLVAPPPPPEPAPAKPMLESPASPLDGRLAELARLATITPSEPLVVALHRYGRELRDLSHDTLDSDLAHETGAITERHFDLAVTRYRHARPSLAGAEADRADEMLRHALERLTDRLRELRHQQHLRDVAGLDEAARFIASRHPAEFGR